MIALPVFAIAASLVMTVAAYLRGDPELPQEYHWEGAPLDQDFAAAHRAREIDVRASLQFLPAAGKCHVVLKLATAPPPVLTVALIHSSRPELDQHLRLSGHDGIYEGPCRALPASGWRIDISDERASWRVRGETRGSLAQVSLSARAD
jgi:hypothetical protein